VPSLPWNLPCRAAAGIAAAFLLVAAPPALVPAPASALPAPDSFADLAAGLLPSVVNILTPQTVKSDRGREHSGHEIPQFPPGSPFEAFFRAFFEHGVPKGGRPDASPS